jgi:SAM-dependent methyltransferase
MATTNVNNNQPIDEAAIPRNDKVLFELNVKGRGLEIGPSFNAVAPKRLGYNVQILDHLDTEGLRKKYAELHPENIEDVDFVWTGQPLTELIGETEAFDWIIASHVVEHIPDLISFLQQCEKLLKPEGRLSLVVPDMRYCFDIFSPKTSTGQMLDAHAQTSVRPSPGQVFDHFANSADRVGAICWDDRETDKLTLSHSIDEAKSMWEKARQSGEYIDVHNWRFTPESFRIVMVDLEMLGLLPLTIVREFGTVGCEFFVTLGKPSAAPATIDRLPMLNAAALDDDRRRKYVAALEAQLRTLERNFEQAQLEHAGVVNTMRTKTSSQAVEIAGLKLTIAQRDRQIKRIQSTWHQKTALTLFRARKKAKTEITETLSVKNAIRKLPADSTFFALQRAVRSVSTPSTRRSLRDSGLKSLTLLRSSNIAGAIDEVRRATKALAAMSQNRSVDILSTHHVSYIAHSLQATLHELGYQTQICYSTDDYIDVGQLFIVLCPQMFAVLPQNYAAFQLEQSVHERWFTDDYFARLKGAIAVLEYSRQNIDYLLNKGIEFNKLFYVPISTTRNYLNVLKRIHPNTVFSKEKTIDVLFYGDHNIPRRQAFLDELSKRFSVRIVCGVFGPELLNVVLASKLVVNIHYYENALLETTRLSEVLSLGVPVISEESADQLRHEALRGAVTFTPIGDIDAMVEAVATLLNDHDAYAEQVAAVHELVDHDHSQRDYFVRFLGAKGYCSFEHVVETTGFLDTSMPSELCLTLPETPERTRDFIKQQRPNFQFFDGLRASPGWIGCGKSYKYMAVKGLETSHDLITICEDDAIFYPSFDADYDRAQRFLKQTNRHWSLFSGLISNLYPEVEILAIETFEGVDYIFINTMVSTVFNIYSRSALKLISQWDHNLVEFPRNTIDYYLKSLKDLVTVTTLPFLVGHAVEKQSTIWGHGNDEYEPMIAASVKLLRSKVTQFKQARGK